MPYNAPAWECRAPRQYCECGTGGERGLYQVLLPSPVLFGDPKETLTDPRSPLTPTPLTVKSGGAEGKSSAYRASRKDRRGEGARDPGSSPRDLDSSHIDPEDRPWYRTTRLVRPGMRIGGFGFRVSGFGESHAGADPDQSRLAGSTRGARRPRRSLRHFTPKVVSPVATRYGANVIAKATKTSAKAARHGAKARVNG
eukprot:3940089-Rhodomonas_salina.5